MEIYFDGYCPESLLKGSHVEMRLNDDDFWESEKTGLQITVFPPYATILRWRGKGKFRKTSGIASNTLVGLIYTEAKHDEGKEIFPEEDNIISNKIDLEWYIDEIHPNKEAFDAAKFNPHDPVFKEKEKHLNAIPKAEFIKMVELFSRLKQQDNNDNFMGSKIFGELHSLLYNLKLIFDFKWMNWHSGWKTINNPNADYSTCSLLEISMYLTAIFRADRFSDGTIEEHFNNGTLQKIFDRIENIALPAV